MTVIADQEDDYAYSLFVRFTCPFFSGEMG
jgi:hypothetical protein